MADVFENARFFSVLDEVGLLLAELDYVDRARAYLEGLPWNATYEMHDVTVGTRHPFDVRITVNLDPTYPEVRGRLGALDDAARARHAGHAETLVAAAGPLVGFDPTEHRDTVRQLSWIHDVLVLGGTKDLGLLERPLDDWTGSAADAFALDFHQPLGLVHANQCYLLQEAAKAIAAATGLFEAAQDSLMNAVVATRDLLDDQLAARASGGTGPSTEDFLTLAGAAAGVLNAVRFAHPPAAAVLSLAVIGTGLVRELGIGDTTVERATIEATSADEVAAALRGAVSRVRGNAGLALSELSGVVGTKRGELAEMAADRRLHAPRPHLSPDLPTGRFRYQHGGR